jgi:uncharacterized protein (TIGR03067 family)
VLLNVAVLWIGLVPAADPPKPDAAKLERQKLQGTWTIVSHDSNGKKVEAKVISGWNLTVAGDRMTTRDGLDILDESTFRLDPGARPKAIDLAFTAGPDKDKSVKGIYKLEGNELTICVAEPGKDRPTALVSKEGSGHLLFVFKRVKKSP